MQPKLQCRRLNLIKGPTPVSMYPDPPNILSRGLRKPKNVSPNSQSASGQRPSTDGTGSTSTDGPQTKNYGQIRSSLLPLNSTPLRSQVSDLSVQFLQVNGPNHIGQLTPKDRTGYRAHNSAQLATFKRFSTQYVTTSPMF